MKQVKTYNFIEITKKEFQQYQSEPITTVQAMEIQNNLFGVVNDFYREELKEFVFIGEPENNSEELTSWDGLFTELIKEADIKSLIALYNECSTDEIHNGKNFVAQIKKIQQLNSNDLYKELYEKLGLRNTF